MHVASNMETHILIRMVSDAKCVIVAVARLRVVHLIMSYDLMFTRRADMRKVSFRLQQAVEDVI